MDCQGLDDGHRAAIGAEHDPNAGKLHGYCVRCGVPWPCAAEQQWQNVRDELIKAAEFDRMAAAARHQAALVQLGKRRS